MLSALNLDKSSRTTITYGDTFGAEEYKLLEVEEGMLQELLRNGLTIKGSLNEEAVLCTSSATYAIKFVSTSNTVLLFPSKERDQPVVTAIEGDAESEVLGHEPVAGAVAKAAGHLELLEISPKLGKLRALLNERPFSDEDVVVECGNERQEQGLYTWSDLLDSVQASEQQLRAALRSLNAVEIGRYWRIVDMVYMQCLLEVIVLTAVQHDWPLNALLELDVIGALERDNFSPHIVRHCLNAYGNTVPSARGEAKDGGANPKDMIYAEAHSKWALDERKVSLHYAKKLLARDQEWKLQEFLTAWEKSLPARLPCTLEILSGEVLLEKTGSVSWVHPFSVSSLPSEPHERFAALFKRRQRWEWEDLEPFLSDLHVPGQSAEAMLLKYTRKMQIKAKASPVYTAR